MPAAKLQVNSALYAGQQKGLHVMALCQGLCSFLTKHSCHTRSFLLSPHFCDPAPMALVLARAPEETPNNQAILATFYM